MDANDCKQYQKYIDSLTTPESFNTATTKEVSFAVIGFVFGLITGIAVTLYLFLNSFGA